jgi:nucleoside-diphosphate-sugar epimerase
MNILITGAAGGIGSTLIRELKSTDHCLFFVDNLRNGYEQNMLDDDGHLLGEWSRTSITENMNDLWAGVNFDAVIHLAAITSLPDCEENFTEAFDVNVTGTANVLRFCKTRGIKNIIFASTSAVYENTKDGLLEEDAQINPTLFYSSTKMMGEHMCDSFRKNYDMNIATLRFFNVFGPRQDYLRDNPPLLNYLVREFCNDRVPMLHSDGNQSRDYVHVDDVVNLIKMCLDKQVDGTYNVCSGVKVSVRQMAEYVKTALHKNIEVAYRDSSKLWDTKPDLFSGSFPLKKSVVTKETNKTSLGSFDKAWKELGWKPQTDLETLIKKVSVEMKNLYFEKGTCNENFDNPDGG